MVTPALSVLPVYFWLSYLVVVSAAIRFHRSLRLSDRRLPVLVQRHRQQRPSAADR